MESALAFLIIIFLFCFLLTSVAFMGRYRASTEKRRYDGVLEREQLAEDFIAYLKTAGDAADEDGFIASLGEPDDKYTVAVTKTPSGAGATDYTLTLTRTSDSAVMLELHAELDAGRVTVTSRHNSGF